MMVVRAYYTWGPLCMFDQKGFDIVCAIHQGSVAAARDGSVIAGSRD